MALLRIQLRRVRCDLVTKTSKTPDGDFRRYCVYKKKTALSSGLSSRSVRRWRLFAQDTDERVVSGTEERPRELRDHPRVVVLAGEDVGIRCAGLVGEVTGDTRCLDKLDQRKSRDPWVFAEVHDHTVTETVHADELTELDGEALDGGRVADRARVAVMEVDGGRQSPRVFCFVRCSYRSVVTTGGQGVVTVVCTKHSCHQSILRILEKKNRYQYQLAVCLPLVTCGSNTDENQFAPYIRLTQVFSPGGCA